MSGSDDRDDNNSHIDKIGGRKIVLAPDAINTTDGHELGHVFGAGDQRKGGVDAVGKRIESFGGDENNLMGNGKRGVNQQALDEIYDSHQNPSNSVIQCKGASEYCL